MQSDRTRSPPPYVTWLGYGGLLPFVGLALVLAVSASNASLASRALLGYGAVILSFVGALHWGIAMSASGIDATWRRRAFVWSVIPALMAWSATLLGGSTGSLILVLGFVLHLTQDHRLAGPAHLPEWYLPLRLRLTVVASLCLLVNAGYGVIQR